MSTEVKSAEPCPTCLLQNKQSNPLINRPGQFFTTCRAGHKFEDTDELNMLRRQARAKYPNIYAGLAPATPTPADPSLFANDDIIIDAETKHTIETVAGFSFTGAGDLKGLIIATVEDNKDKEMEIKSLRAQLATLGTRARAIARPGSPDLQPNQIVITLPEWAMEGGIAAQAEHAGMSIEDWVNDQVGGYFENYFTPQGRR